MQAISALFPENAAGLAAAKRQGRHRASGGDVALVFGQSAVGQTPVSAGACATLPHHRGERRRAFLSPGSWISYDVGELGVCEAGSGDGCVGAGSIVVSPVNGVRFICIGLSYLFTPPVA